MRAAPPPDRRGRPISGTDRLNPIGGVGRRENAGGDKAARRQWPAGGWRDPRRHMLEMILRKCHEHLPLPIPFGQDKSITHAVKSIILTIISNDLIRTD